MQKDNYLTVSALTQYIKRKFDVDPYLGKVYLVGEISNFRNRANSHQYFALKDNNSKISAIMFKSKFSKLKFKPEEGMKVFVTGHISLYEPSGTYQIYIDNMQPDGIGAFWQAFEQLKAKLQNEGAFDIPKKMIPQFPKRIAVITSASGAVIRDIITTTARRYPMVQLVLFPAQVQGEKSASDLVRQIERVNEYGNFDTLIIGRGGGSIEDLWTFNEEKVARAIIKSEIPVISSVGHETDTTIADLVADVRAATPTAAAELATPELKQLLLQIMDFRKRIYTVQKNSLEFQFEKLMKLQNRSIMKNPERIYDVYAQKSDQLKSKLQMNLEARLRNSISEKKLVEQKLLHNSPKILIDKNLSELRQLRQKLSYLGQSVYNYQRSKAINLVSGLDSLSPLKTLTRGYAIVTDDQGNLLNNSMNYKENEKLNIKVINGVIKATVDEVIEDEK